MKDKTRKGTYPTRYDWSTLLFFF